MTDIGAICAELRSQGLRLHYETPRRGTTGARIDFVHPKDAGGVLVELVEPLLIRPDQAQLDQA